ncbi:LAMI_0G14180g1_1 [Lachancea mirantina]|uniref:Altered inheritance of mitochondria protein 23, mitochondrial n=1 Tax=Lachancea mirantina TaxID=1230905 RepID=A0A1G4KC09_9SACH|nr:LAMI_0G14180g1_1 [Lachancea mirantina]
MLTSLKYSCQNQLKILPSISSRFFTNRARHQKENARTNNDILLNTTALLKSQKSNHRDDKFSRQVIPKKRAKPIGLSSHRKRLALRWSGGNERAQQAANWIIERSIKINSRGIVKMVNTESNKLEEVQIQTLPEKIDLSSQGLILVDVEEQHGSKIPLIKIVEAKTALKRYSDAIASRKEKELSRLGISARTGKKPEKDKDSCIKQIKVSWQISDSDLVNQKANEIESQLQKGLKVHLYVDSKDALSKANWTNDFNSTNSSAPIQNNISKKELKRREFIVEALQKIAENSNASYTLEGSSETRLIMKLASKSSGNSDEKKTIKEHNRREKQAKIEKRVEKKRLREAQKRTNANLIQSC